MVYKSNFNSVHDFPTILELQISRCVAIAEHIFSIGYLHTAVILVPDVYHTGCGSGLRHATARLTLPTTPLQMLFRHH